MNYKGSKEIEIILSRVADEGEQHTIKAKIKEEKKKKLNPDCCFCFLTPAIAFVVAFFSSFPFFLPVQKFFDIRIMF